MDFSTQKQKLSANDKSFTSVDLSNTTLSSANLTELVSLLKSNTFVTSLSFAHTKLSYADSLILSTLFLQNHTITSLNLSFCGLDDQSCNNFNLILSYSPIESYDISNNNISLNSFLFLSALLRRNNYSLKKLELNDNPGLSFNQNDAMRIDGSNPENEGLKELCRLIRETPTLEKLGLSGLGLGDNEIQELVSALKENTSIRELNLQNNKIGRSGFLSLRSLFSSRCLVSQLLIEEGNWLSPLELKELAQLGARNQRITESRKRARTKIETIPAEANKTFEKMRKDLFAAKFNLLKESLCFLENQSEGPTISVDNLFDRPQQAINSLLLLQQQNVDCDRELLDLREQVSSLERENHSLSLQNRSLSEKLSAQ